MIYRGYENYIATSVTNLMMQSNLYYPPYDSHLPVTFINYHNMFPKPKSTMMGSLMLFPPLIPLFNTLTSSLQVETNVSCLAAH